MKRKANTRKHSTLFLRQPRTIFSFVNPSQCHCLSDFVRWKATKIGRFRVNFEVPPYLFPFSISKSKSCFQIAPFKFIIHTHPWRDKKQQLFLPADFSPSWRKVRDFLSSRWKMLFEGGRSNIFHFSQHGLRERKDGRCQIEMCDLCSFLSRFL